MISWLQVNAIPACQLRSRKSEDSIRVAKQNDEDADPSLDFSGQVRLVSPRRETRSWSAIQSSIRFVS